MKVQIAAVIFVACYIGHLVAERTVTLDGKDGTTVKVTFVGRYPYINEDPPGEDLEVSVKIQYFKEGETTPYTETMELATGTIPGSNISEDEREKAFDKVEEDFLEELKKKLAADDA